MERSFKKEVELLRLGAGEVFHGEGILAVTKGLLQSGVSFVGGYPGAPVSNMIDVLVDAREIMGELGIHVETNASEAGSAAMLGASISHPVRGAVAWKSTVGTNVAADALSNLASAGVTGGAMIVIGEDYGEGASIIQERSHAFAMKSQMWMLDPRPDLTKVVETVEQGFALSEASNTPVMLQLRIRACHVQGSFVAKDNVKPRYSKNDPLPAPVFNLGVTPLPPFNYLQEKHKIAARWPAAVRFIRDARMNEVFAGEIDDLGIVVMGGLYNVLARALELAGVADAFGEARIPIYVLNVTYPLVPEEVTAFCAGKRAVLLIEEGQPAYIEDALNVLLRKADAPTVVNGKDVLPLAGEYTGEVVLGGLVTWLERLAPRGVDLAYAKRALEQVNAPAKQALELLGGALPPRPPGFCVGCPERPVFTAMKLLERETGPFHVACDVGCHSFSLLPPFSIGNTVLGYGLGLSSASSIAPLFATPTISIMGDGGFWHNGLTSGIANAVYNRSDGVLVIMKNGYTSATGTQNIPSSPHQGAGAMSIESALAGLGVKWVKSVYTYRVSEMVETLRQAMAKPAQGLRVIIADAECQLERQRRLRPQVAKALAAGERVVRTRFGVDEDVCTGDHSCIRLSGCPSLTVKPNPDPLRSDPVAHVDNGCVGCGLCGEVAHAAVLCPSFFRAEIVQNATAWDRFVDRLRRRVIGWLMPARKAA